MFGPCAGDLSDSIACARDDGRYKEGITGSQSAQKGLSMMSEAAKDPSMLMESLNALKDPAMMKEVQEMMADPEFQAEMQKIMADPSMQQAMQQSKEYVEQLSQDPKKFEQVRPGFGW